MRDALGALLAYRQWVVWIPVPSSTRPGKVDKFVVDPRTGTVCNAHDPAAWLSADDAFAATANGHRIGFVFTSLDPFFFIDLDECLQPDGQSWSPLAQWWCQQFPGAAVEVSQSGRGLHIIGSYTACPAHSCKNKGLAADLYTDGRFVALTGSGIVGSAGTDHTAMLGQIAAAYFPPKADGKSEEWATEPRADWHGPTDDAELLDKMLRSGGANAVFGGSVTFRDLWGANVAALGRRWPDDHNLRRYDESAADAALMQHLAFWTGCDCERMERLARQSKLVREKWDNRAGYLQRTILQACAQQGDVYSNARAPVQPVAPVADVTATVSRNPMNGTDGPQLVTGFQFLAVHQQVEYFAGCVYVRDRHEILTPDGDLLDQGRFRATYGGYTFAMDSQNEKTTKNAWEAFTESHAVRYPKAKDTIFRPEREPGELLEDAGQVYVNSYFPARVERTRGDVSKFLNHLAKMLPDERDRTIVLSYMAACVQHKGVKFQWAPLLQGVEGNGKTMIGQVVAEAIGRRYVHPPKPDQVSNNFNAWIRDKLLILMEDVYLAEKHIECIESLKPLITNVWQPVEPKGVDQKMAYCVANFILNSNHKNAIKKTRNDRRFALFFTAQQSADDLEADGMSGRYFPDLYDWLHGRNAYAGQPSGYSMMTEFLYTYQIAAEFNPATDCQRAPTTSSTNAAIEASLGSIEQEINEAIEEGAPGFAGGWVSSLALDKLLQKLRKADRVPQARRRELMQSLGYDWHPALKGGRVNNFVQPDGGRPRLYIKQGHISANLTQPGEVARAYSDAQTQSAVGRAAAVFGSGYPTNGN